MSDPLTSVGHSHGRERRCFEDHRTRNGDRTHTNHAYTAYLLVCLSYTLCLDRIANPICRNLDAFQGSEDILGHHLRVDGSRVVAVDGDAIPTGEFINVTNTPFDFRNPERIDFRWNETEGLCLGGDYSFPTDAVAFSSKYS